MKRTVKATYYFAKGIIINEGEVKERELTPVPVVGRQPKTDVGVKKLFSNQLNAGANESVIVYNTKTEESVYEMDIETFLKYATKVK